MGTREKFNTVFPNNTIRSGVPFTPVSTVYKSALNQFGPLEDIQWGNDVRLTLNTFSQGSQSTIRIAPTEKLLGRVIFSVTSASSLINTGYYGYKNAWQWTCQGFLERFSWRLPNSERMDYENYMTLLPVLRSLETTERKKSYLEMCGPAWKDIRENDRFFMILPLPCSNGCSDPDRKSFPFPLHMLSAPIELTFKMASKFPFSIKTAEIIFEYAELALSTEYKSIVYRYPYHQHYGNVYPVKKAITRSVQLLGLRAGETSELIFWYKPTIGTIDLKTTLRSYSDVISGVSSLPKDLNQVPYGPSPYYGTRLKNIKLLYSGKTIWRLDDSYEKPFQFFQSRLINTFGWEMNNHWAPSVSIRDTTNNTFRTNEKSLKYSGFRALFNDTTGVGGTEPGDVNNPIAQDALLSIVEKKLNPGFYYIIPLAEILDEYTNNGYSLGTDISGTEVKLEFELNSHDILGFSDPVVYTANEHHRILSRNDDKTNTLNNVNNPEYENAENNSEGNLFVIQSITSVLEFNGTGAETLQ